MKKIIVLLISVAFLSVACNNNGDKRQNRQQSSEKSVTKKTSGKKNIKTDKFPQLTPEEHFHAVVYDTMTLSQVAKENNVGLPFLKTKLGIPNSVKRDYTIKQLKRNFRFTTERLKEIIEDAKNRTAVINKRKKLKK
jgi:hypothetical protein